ncbi:cardiolipin synthase [uncultured Faecalicoccus sp.]|uniref:cardiolipin synthase n=1 Tax=uncultured Faecalicoccus sp. TaxID=1971760 RepID=UPI0026327884|nr:cardiolipin synthase [uncultured Faecalicoccus sp.]
MHKYIRIIKSKPFFIAMAFLIQILAFILLLTWFSRRFFGLYFILVLLSFFISVQVINRESDSSSKLLWVLVIMFMPVFGGVLYLLFGARKIPRELMIKDRQAASDYQRYAKQSIKVMKQESDDFVLDKMVSLAWSNGYFPVYDHCSVQYFPSGEKQYQAFLKELSEAKSFIFMEFFIINQSVMWDTILQILIDKASEGVDVRLIYDDFGTITYLPDKYDQWLTSRGVKTHRFNPMKAQIAMQMNNRDHRKILVVDGKVAFTGGCNISDEYINTRERFGHWKDMGVCIKGAAVETFTISFLQMWNYQEEENTPYAPFIVKKENQIRYDEPGYVIPFSDSPTDENYTGKYMHLNLLNASTNYFWITTPYLILDDEMVSSLQLAVNNGVDVRIVVPAIPDKKAVYQVTKANYDALIKKGVRIYEYSPGFIHGKVALSDDRSALVGTVNMDFRSYYLHYECGVFMRDTSCLQEIHDDFEDIFSRSHEVTLEECEQVNFFLRQFRKILKVFGPML